MVMMINSDLVARHHMQFISEIDKVAMQTDCKYIQAQNQRKDRSGFSDHS